MVDYNRAPVFEQEDESEEIITSSDFSTNMPTELPADIFTLPDKPGVVPPLDLSALLLDRDVFAETFGAPQKTKEELDAMFPDADYKSDKYLALAKAGLALMQPTLGGKIAPAISQAGISLVNDMGAISSREKAENRANKSQRLTFEQQQQANELQLKAQAFGINQKLLETQLLTNYSERAKKNAAQWEAYNNAVNTNAEKALQFGIKKFESEPVTIRYMDKGQYVERAGFRVNDQYYIPTKQKDVNGEWIYQIVPDPTSVEIISTKSQDVDNISKNMTQHNEIYADMMNISKNIYSLRQIMQSVDPELGGDPTRVALTGYIKSMIQKYGQIASDFTKDFFAEEYIDPVTQVRAGGQGKTVWLSDLSDIVSHAKEDSGLPPEAVENWKMINTLLDSIEADGMALIDRARNEDLSKHFEGDTEAERQANKTAIFNRLKFDTKIPENEARAQAIIYALARARKSTGRLNLDDIERAAETLNIYGDSSQGVLTKLRVVQDELLAAHQTQVDLYKRNFPNDAAILEKERGTLSYVIDGVFVGDDYYNNFFGNSVTPKKITYTVIKDEETGGWTYVPLNQQ